MEKLLLIILFFVSLASVKAQDKIITIKKDTIECRIVSVNAERISYEQKSSDNHLIGKSISTAEVFQYLRASNADSNGDRFVYEKVRRQRPEHRWLFSLQGGLAHSFTDYGNFKNYLVNSGNSASMVDDYLNSRKNGVQLNTSLHYLVSNFIGLGVDYNLFYSASKGEFLYTQYNSGYGADNGLNNLPVYFKLGLDERLYVQFAGPSVLFQQYTDKKKKIKITETLAPGIILYRDESRDNDYMEYWGDRDFYNGQPPRYYGQANSVAYGTAYGAKGSLSIEYTLAPQLTAGLAGNFMWARLHKLSTKYPTNELKDQELQDPINLSHIDYGFIVRYNF